MALIRANTNGGGGSLTPTTLWSNPDTSQSFPLTSASLSQDMDNFDYLKVTYYISTSDRTTEYETGLMPVDEFKIHTGAPGLRYGLFYVNTQMYVRAISYENDTSVKLGPCQQTGSTATTNNTLIPKAIIGLKK